MRTTVKIIMTAAIMTIFSIASNAQICVSGIEVRTKMTKEEVIAKFGEPINYEYYDSKDNGVDEWYYYDKIMLHFNDESFDGFSIKNNRFKVSLEGLDCDVTVGDKFSILEPLKPVYMDWFGENWYSVYYYNGDTKICFEVIDGIIQCMTYSTPL